MPYSLTKKDQEGMLDAAQTLTGSTGWLRDAVAFGAKRDDSPDPRAVGVFQNFAGETAEFHFAMLDGKRMTKEVLEAFMFVAFHRQMFNLKHLSIIIPVSNIMAQRSALGTGCVFEYRKRGGVSYGEDLVVMSLEP